MCVYTTTVDRSVIFRFVVVVVVVVVVEYTNS